MHAMIEVAEDFLRTHKYGQAINLPTRKSQYYTTMIGIYLKLESGHFGKTEDNAVDLGLQIMSTPTRFKVTIPPEEAVSGQEHVFEWELNY